MIDFTIKKQTSKVTRDQIIDYLDKKFWEEKEYECMPENEYGYEYVPREALGKIVDGLIPMVKNMIKQKNNSSPNPRDLEMKPPQSQADLDYLREAFRKKQELPITDEERYQEEEYNLEGYQIMIGCFATIGALAFILAGMYAIYLIAQAIFNHTGI